jgi:hypothetical protein
MNVPDQIRQKNRRTLQDADQVNALAFVVLLNLGAYFANALLNRAAAQQDFQMFLPVTVH